MAAADRATVLTRDLALRHARLRCTSLLSSDDPVLIFYQTDKERFIRGWFVTMAADPDHIIPAYTYTLFRVDGFKHFLFESVMFQRDMAEDDYDETAFVNSRLTILNGQHFVQFASESLHLLFRSRVCQFKSQSAKPDK